MKYDVFGIGSALMDVLIEVDHNKLLELNLKKGNFHLIDEKSSRELLEKLRHHKSTTCPGGSSANTLYGVAILGGNVVFCGKIGEDKYADIYEKGMSKSRVKTQLARCKKITGNAITFITPEGERTFAVHLGASMYLQKEDVFFEDLKNSKILHIEGYQLEDKQLRDVSIHAMEFAKKNNVKISIDLGDPGIVSRNKEDLKKMIENYADIVFANEDEAKALTGLEAIDALNEIAKLVKIAIVKLGEKGSYIKEGNNIYNIPCYKTKAKDTTGAGDMFAAGVLYGISKKYDLKTAGCIGSYFASKVVEQIGARLEKIDKKEIEKLLSEIK
jgi:sugar/nucleoside kinase (ribokinase family)